MALNTRPAPSVTPAARAELAEAAGGAALTDLARALVDAIDPDRVAAHAAATGATEDAAGEVLREAACKPLASNFKLRERIVEVMRASETVVDELTPDRVLSEGFDPRRAAEVTERFREFVDAEADRLAALSILYSRPHAARRIPGVAR